MAHHQTGAFAFGSRPIGVKMAHQLGPTQAPFLFDASFHRRKGVCRGRQRCAVHAQVVELHAPVRSVQSAFDRAITEQVQHEFGEHLVHVFHVKIKALGQHPDCASQVFFEAPPERLDAWFAGCVGHHLAQRHIEHDGEVHLGDVVQGVLTAGDRAPMTTGIGARPRQLQRVSVAGKPADRVVYAQKLRRCVLIREDNLHAPFEQARIGVIAHAYADIGRDVETMCGFEGQIGHAIRCVAPGLVRPAELDVGRVAQQQAREVIDGLLIVEDARRDVAFVERQ